MLINTCIVIFCREDTSRVLCVDF